MDQIELLNSRCSLLSLVDNILAEFRKRIDDVSNFRNFCIKNVLWRESLGNSRSICGQNALNRVTDDCLQICGAGTKSSRDGEFFSVLSDDAESFSIDGRGDEGTEDSVGSDFFSELLLDQKWFSSFEEGFAFEN